VYYFTVFPTFFLSFHPDYLLVHWLDPRAVDRTHVTCDFLFSPEVKSQNGFDPNDAVEFWDLTNRQDWAVCERVQSGARSRAFSPGPLSNLESIVAAFDRHYRTVMSVD
jgi:Rieske 2Fe-2S family protein